MTHRLLASRAFFALLLVFMVVGAGCKSSSGGQADAGAVGVNECTNASDIAIIESMLAMTDGGVPDASVGDGGTYPVDYWNALAVELLPCGRETCLAEILAESGAVECISACLETTPAAGISGGCIGCLGALLKCAGPACATACVGSDEATCLACNYAACGDVLSGCTGLPVPTVP